MINPRLIHLLLLALGLAAASVSHALEKPVWREVGIDQNIGKRLPLDLEFRDETGQPVRLGDYFSTQAVIITPVYFECPMLCTQVLNGLVRTLKVTPLDVGRDFQIITFSFNPKETPELAAAKKQNYLAELGRESATGGWHFLTGSEESITSLTSALGFRYVWDEKLQQYAHAAAIIVATPDGRIARYFYGIDYPPRDLRFGLVEASQGRLGNVVDQVLLLCYKYDPMTGRYGWAVITSVRIAGIVTVLALGTFIFFMLRREKRARKLAQMEHGA